MDAVKLPDGTGLYHFDKVFDDQASQVDVFDHVKPFAQAALSGDYTLNGSNVSIFTYGQSGSGKTHTM